MGLFGKLFEKKECSICGGEIGLLGNRKLEDGNMCKNCAAQLSPWFSDRRHSTVDEINAQLAYREQNRQELKSFRPAWRIGENYKMIAEERNGVPYRFVVTSNRDFMEENSDLIYFTDVSSCNINVDESSHELKHQNKEGEMVSYHPPRFEFSYNFHVHMTIENNPFFDEIEFKLNNFSVDIKSDTVRVPGQGFGDFIFGRNEFDPTMHPEYRKFMRMCDEIEALVEAGRSGGYFTEEEYDAPQQEVYEVPQQDVQACAPAAAPKFCPNCGTPVSGGKFCANCGAKLGG